MPIIKRALLSVSDKRGLLELAKGLQTLGVDLLSTGGTSKLLRDSGVPIREVGDYTGQPEILDGRLKTLHPKIHGGLLAIRSNPRHMQELKKFDIEPIDLVVVNLYPFEETIAKEGVSLELAIENIDIGGPTMIRAAAKNWQDVTVLVDPADYQLVLDEMRRGDSPWSPLSGQARRPAPTISAETNFRLAQKVFAYTARYDGAITNYLTGGREKKWPEVFNCQVVKIQDLRYGENPHQKGAFYRDVVGAPLGAPPTGVQQVAPLPSVANAKQLHGKELSFNNILDLDAALGLISEFQEPACVIVKHTNPCGVALTPDPSPAGGRGVFMAARECDSLSVFGGIIGFNRPVDAETACEIAKDFYECIVAPGFDPEAFQILAAKKNIRLMEISPAPPLAKGGWGDLDFKRVTGGLLVQDKDILSEDIRKSKIATKRAPTDEEWKTLSFAWKVAKHVKSNAIVFAGNSPLPSAGEGPGVRVTLGIGCGQMSRIDSVKLGIMKAVGALLAAPEGARQGVPLQGAVMASDAFFPFRDNVDEAAKAGITAIIQPGGSLKDQESIDAANEHRIAMVFTGVRHFRH